MQARTRSSRAFLALVALAACGGRVQSSETDGGPVPGAPSGAPSTPSPGASSGGPSAPPPSFDAGELGGSDAWAAPDAPASGSPDAEPSPPCAGDDPYWQDVVLLLHFDGADGSTVFDDATGRHALSVHGSAQVTTAFSRFGGGSLYLGNPMGSAYLTSADSPDWDLTTGDSTVEMWIDPISLPSVNPALLTQSPVSNDGQWTILITRDPPFPLGALNVQDNGNPGFSTSGTVSMGQWQHVAVVRASGRTLLFLDGRLQGQGGQFYTLSGNDLYIGATNTDTYGSQYLWNGYIDELRITRGVARYTASFTPPTAELDPSCPDGDP